MKTKTINPFLLNRRGWIINKTDFFGGGWQMRGRAVKRRCGHAPKVGDLKIDNDLLPTKTSASHPARAAGRYGHMYALSQFPT